MQKVNLIFGAISLIIGLALIVASLISGIKLLGLILGSLLLLNGLARLWLSRKHPALTGDAVSEQQHLPQR